MACRSSLGCFGCKYLKHYYYSAGNMDCKLKGHITLGFGDDMGCDKTEEQTLGFPLRLMYLLKIGKL